MLKKLIMFIIIIIFIFTILAPMSCASFTPTVVELYDGKVIAYSEISAFKLTLANGAVIASATVSGDSQQIVTTTSANIQVVLIIDVSGSMTGTRIEKAKSSAKTLVENLYGLSEGTQVGLISFSSDAQKLTDLTTSKDTVLNAIDGLNAYGGTNMSPSLDLASQMLSQGKSDYEAQDPPTNEDGETLEKPDLHQYCVILTDGATESPESCYQKLQNMDENGISIYGILLESNYIDAFGSNGNTIGKVYVNISNQELLDIYNEIFDEIYNELVENVVTEFEFSNEPQNCIILSNGIFITLDNELMQGARLDLEYVVNIKSTMDINSVEVEDLTNGNLVYDGNSSLLSEENKINSDYGWNPAVEPRLYTNDDKLVIGVYENSSTSTPDNTPDNPPVENPDTPTNPDSPEYIPTPPTDENDGIILISTDGQAGGEQEDSTAVIKAGETYKKKIIYSKMLSSAEESKFEHSTIFRLNNDSENGMATMESLPVIITPPYGENNNNVTLIIFIALAIVLAIVLIKIIQSISLKTKNISLYKKK